jgi:CDP-diacylglycerol--glycerol-3-phosphate 3-phosphatidyltransferase
MISAEDETQVRPPQASAWNIANALTILRIALVPVFAWFLLHDGGQLTSYRLLAAAVFVVATATDRIDGDIARARGEVTDFGKVSDPIADKALMGMALIGLSIIDLLPWWVTVMVLIRELGVTALRFVVIRHGVISASRGGKLKTALQAVAILLYILPLSASWHVLAVATMALAVIVTMVTGVDYVLRAHTLRNTSPRAQLLRERRAAAALKAAAGDDEVGEPEVHEAKAPEAAAGEKAVGEKEAGEAAAGEKTVREEAAPESAAGEKAVREAVTCEKAAGEAVTREKAAGEAAAGPGAGPEV